MPLSICSDSEDDVERPQSAKTSIDLSSMPWPNNIVNLEDVSHWYFKKVHHSIEVRPCGRISMHHYQYNKFQSLIGSIKIMSKNTRV